MTSKKRLILILASIFAVCLLIVAVTLMAVYLPRLNGVKIKAVEITLNDNAAENFSVEIYSQDIKFSVDVDCGKGFKPKNKIKVEWKITENLCNSSIAGDGSFNTGDTFGEVILTAVVSSKNVVEKSVTVNVVPKSGSEIKSISVDGEKSVNTFIEGQELDKSVLFVWGDFGSYGARLTDFEADKDVLTPLDTEVIVSYRQASALFPISVAGKTLQSIEILHAPYTTRYAEGQVFDRHGLVVQANFEYLSETVENFYADEETLLSMGVNSMQISYTYEGVTKTVVQPIIVSHRVLISISVDDTNVQKQYVQGDLFNSDGLKVYAKFDVIGTREVENYDIEYKSLICSDTEVVVRYTENGETKRAAVSGITVNKPYEIIRRVIVRDTESISLNWFYSYMTDEGEFKNDNTAYFENDLEFDVVNGIYDIPVGAVVNLKSTNPAVVDFELDGIEQGVAYPDCFMSFKMSGGEALKISTTFMAGERIVLRFTSQEAEQTFLYEANWNAPLKENDYKKLSMIFRDTETYYHTYSYGKAEYTLAQLESAVFEKNTVIKVTKIERTDEAVNLKLRFYEDFEIEYAVDIKAASLADLPTVSRTGYDFAGWAFEENGAQIDEDAFLSYLQGESEEYVLFACWTVEAVNYSGELIGTWEITAAGAEDTLICRVTFLSNGTFSYEVRLNGELNNSCTGFYRLTDGDISVIDIQPDGEIPSVTKNDFEFTLDNHLLKTSVFIKEDNSVIKGIMELAKA